MLRIRSQHHLYPLLPPPYPLSKGFCLCSVCLCLYNLILKSRPIFPFPFPPSLPFTIISSNPLSIVTLSSSLPLFNRPCHYVLAIPHLHYSWATRTVTSGPSSAPSPRSDQTVRHATWTEIATCPWTSNAIANPVANHRASSTRTGSVNPAWPANANETWTWTCPSHEIFGCKDTKLIPFVLLQL